MTERFEWIDFSRGLLMALVFVYHSEVYYYHDHSYSWMFTPFFLTGFFFVSGFLFSKDIQNVSIKSKVKQIFRGLLIPYLIFESLLFIPKILTGRGSAYQLLGDVLLFRGSWFIIAIGVMQLLYAIVLRVSPTKISLILSSILFFVLGTELCSIYFVDSAFYNKVLASPILFSADLPNRMPFCLNLALFNCPFFGGGIFCSLYRNRFVSMCEKKYMFLLSLMGYISLYCVIDHFFIGSYWTGATGAYHNLPLMIIYSILGIWMTCSLSVLVKKIHPINYIGKYSIVFAFVNGACLTIASLLMNKLENVDASNYFNQLTVALIALILAWVVTALINKFFPIMRGEKESFNKISEKIGVSISW